MLGNLSELSSPTEKLTAHKGNSTVCNNSNNFINENNLIDLGFLGKPLHGIVEAFYVCSYIF